MLECFITMNWLIVSFMVLLFPRNGNLNVLKDELPSKRFDLIGAKQLPFESLSNVSNRQLYGSRHFLFGVPTSKNSTLKPVTEFTTNLSPSIRNLNDEKVLKKKLSSKSLDLNAAREFPSLSLSDVANRQLYGSQHFLFGVLQGHALTSKNSTLKPVAKFATNLPTSLQYFNNKKALKNSKISNVLDINNRKNLSVNKTFKSVSNATNILQRSIPKNSSAEHNIQFADDSSRPSNILASQRTDEASENSEETHRSKTFTAEDNEISNNLTAEDLQSRFNSSSKTTTVPMNYSLTSPKTVVKNSSTFLHKMTNFETSVSSNNTSTLETTQNNPMTTDLDSTELLENSTDVTRQITDLDTSLSLNNTITPNTTQYSTMTKIFSTSASTDNTNIYATTENSTMIPTKCPCTDQPGLVAGTVVAVMCLIVILFTGTFFLIKRKWKDDPESQHLLK